MTKLLGITLAVLALALAGPAGAQNRTPMDGPDLSGLPPGTLKDGSLSKRQKAALANIAKLDPRLAGKIEKKLKRTPRARDRFVYLFKQVAKIDQRIDLAELNHKKGFADKKPITAGRKISSNVNLLLAIYWNVYARRLQAQDKAEATQHTRRFAEIMGKYLPAYGAFRDARRESFGLDEGAGTTEPKKKKAGDKPKTPAKGKPGTSKQSCSGEGLQGGMNCVEQRIDEEG